MNDTDWSQEGALGPSQPLDVSWGINKVSICLSLFLLATPHPQGAKVIMACRDMDRAQAAVQDVMERSGSQNVVCMKLDLADTKSIREFAEAINQG